MLAAGWEMKEWNLNKEPMVIRNEAARWSMFLEYVVVKVKIYFNIFFTVVGFPCRFPQAVWLSLGNKQN